MSDRYCNDYTQTELMAVSAAREVRDGEVVFTGTGLPMLAGMLAQHTHAPHSILIFETGVIDPQLLQLPMGVSDPRLMHMAAMSAGSLEVFSILQAGDVDVGFLGGAQIDIFGNINSTSVGEYHHPSVRFTGSGGACDIACLAKRTIIIAAHEKRRFPDKVDYITSPGWIDGSGARERAGLLRGGPAAVVTTMGIIRFNEKTKRAYLDSYFPGLTPEILADNTGFKLDISQAVETEKPTEKEIQTLRGVVDPDGIFLRR